MMYILLKDVVKFHFNQHPLKSLTLHSASCKRARELKGALLPA